MRIRKILSLTALVTVALCLLSSCIPHHELKETAIVQAVGVDRTEQGIFELTMQIYSPQGAGSSTAIDTSKNNSSIISGTGETLAAAVQDATLRQGKVIFTGHNRVLVLGRAFAEQGIADVFSYFNRNALTKQNIRVLMADGTAKEILATDISQGILAAETIRRLVENGAENGMVYSMPFYELIKNMYLYRGAAAMPVISVIEGQQDSGDGKQQEEQNTQKTIESVTKLAVERTAVFRDYKLTAELDGSQTRGLNLLRSRLSQSVLIADAADGGKCSVNIYQCKASLRPVFVGETVEFLLKAKVRASLDEVIAKGYGGDTERDIAELQKRCSLLLAEEALSAYETGVQDAQSDLLYLSNLLLKKDKRIWEKLLDDFESHLPDMPLRTEIDFRIDRIGMETDHKAASAAD